MIELVRIFGRLINTDTRNPVPYVLVSADGLIGSSDTNGNFSINVQPNKTYQVIIRSPLHGPITTTVNVGAGDYNMGDVQIVTAIFNNRALR